MMKISTTKKTSKRITMIITVVLLLAAAGYIAYAYSSKVWPFALTQTDSGPTQEEKKLEQEYNAQSKQDFLDKNENESSDPQDSSSTTNTSGASKSDSSAFPVSLKAETVGANLVITTDLAHTPSGECLLTLQKESRTITRTAEVIYSPEHSTCAGFSIDLSELSKGTWKISLSVTTGAGKSSESITYRI